VPTESFEPDYRQLLRQGYLKRELAHTLHNAWRSEMRRRAHDDHLRIRTGAGTTPDHVWATLLDWQPDETERRTALNQLATLTLPPEP
jgi:hypothetical protein